MPPNQGINLEHLTALSLQDLQAPSGDENGIIRCAILGCGMMGQEHISYISGYDDARIDFLCDPHKPSIEKSISILKQFKDNKVFVDDDETLSPVPDNDVTVLHSETELLKHASQIDLLVIATPNYLHASMLEHWGKHNMTILLEKPVAVSQEQHDLLQKLQDSPNFIARVWVAMEYRYIPAISKLISLLPSIGDLKMITIRENRFPFLHKIEKWNRDPHKTGDTLVEKCCHFFDLFRLISGKEISKRGIRTIAQRGLNYHDEELHSKGYERPIIDAAYVFMPFREDEKDLSPPSTRTMGCLELCMYADGSRHQEEIIVTGTKGRLEAYLPENKVYQFQRPDSDSWKDRSLPPPKSSIIETVYDCSDVKNVHGIDDGVIMPTHGGHHYCSTAVEWYHLLRAINHWKETGEWNPQVSLTDGLRAVEIGMRATRAIINENNDEYLLRSNSSPVY